MVRTVKTKTTRSLNKGERAVLLPGPTGAEPWEVWILGAKAEASCVQICATPPENRLRKSTTLALPVSQVFCQPLWLNETDANQFARMIPLQLELRGLQPRGNKPGVSDWSVVTVEGNRTLVMVGVLPASWNQELQVDAYQAFDLSARYLSFPENALTLWREQDRLTVALTRGKNLVYFQTLGEGPVTPRVLQDLTCLRATLAMQGILTSLQQVVLWMETDAGEQAALRTSLQLPITSAQRPPPRPPSPPWKLTPGVVSDAQRSREIWRWRKRGILLALVVYLLVVAALFTRFFLISREIDHLRKWQAAHAQVLAQIHDTQEAWRELRPVVDENDYPLELLKYTTEAIPADELHLTLFETGNGHLLIKGEAKNVTAAYQFFDKLKNDPHFTAYNLDMGQPPLSANDLAQLQIEGTRATTN